MLVPDCTGIWDNCFLRGKNNFNDLRNMKIATWNVMTLNNNYHIKILTDEFRQFKLDFLEVPESHILRATSMKLGYKEFVYSGSRDGCVDSE